MFIKKIFQNQIDESVHKQFIRFSKGQYENKAIINIKKGQKIKITTSFELATDLIIFITSLATKFKVQGILLTKNQISGIDGKKKKGFYEYKIEKEISSEELKNFASESYYALFDCLSQDNSIELKTKKKIPKPGKSKTKVNDKFCKLTLDARYWPQVHNEFLFDFPSEIKKAHIEHTYIINDIKIPKELEKQDDYEKIRLGAKKIGKIIRKAIIDKKEFIKEKDFEA